MDVDLELSLRQEILRLRKIIAEYEYREIQGEQYIESAKQDNIRVRKINDSYYQACKHMKKESAFKDTRIHELEMDVMMLEHNWDASISEMLDQMRTGGKDDSNET